jgi:hypothetical protein
MDILGVVAFRLIYSERSRVLGCYDFSATSPSTRASSSAAVDLVAPVPLVPLLPGGAAAVSCSPPSRRVGQWTPHRSDCSTARPTAPASAHPIQQRLFSTSYNPYTQRTEHLVVGC